MKASCLLLSLLVLSVLPLAGQASPNETPYQTMVNTISNSLDYQKTFNLFITSLSKDDFRRLLSEYRENMIQFPEGDIFTGMAMMAMPYYRQGAGKRDGLRAWSQDIIDRSFPNEWRYVIIQHPPFRTDSLTVEERTQYTNILSVVAFSRTEAPILRRSALLAMENGMKLREYANLLQRQIASEGEDPDFRREALRHISRIVTRGKADALDNADFRELTKEYEATLVEMVSRTNLPSVLSNEVKRLKSSKYHGTIRIKMPLAEKE
jgi:hypothetical protein